MDITLSRGRVKQNMTKQVHWPDSASFHLAPAREKQETFWLTYISLATFFFFFHFIRMAYNGHALVNLPFTVLNMYEYVLMIWTFIWLVTLSCTITKPGNTSRVFDVCWLWYGKTPYLLMGDTIITKCESCALVIINEKIWNSRDVMHDVKIAELHNAVPL